MLNLVLEVFTTGRDVLRDRQDKGSLNPSVLAWTRELIAYLQDDVRKIRIALAAGDLDGLRHCWLDFFEHLKGLGEWVDNINIGMLAIYDPYTASLLRGAFGLDAAVVGYFVDNQQLGKYREGLIKFYKDNPAFAASVPPNEPPFDILNNESRSSTSITPWSQRKNRKNLRKIRALQERLRVVGSSTGWQGAALTYEEEQLRGHESEHVSDLGPIDYGDVANLGAQLHLLERVLEQCSESIASFIRTNWTPKDLS